MPANLSLTDLAALDQLHCTIRKVAAGTALYRAGDPFENLYTIKAGSFNTTILLADGREQITGFQIIGESLGVDGANSNFHQCDAISLEDSVLCTIPFHGLEKICLEVQAMHRYLNRLMGAEISRESGHLLLLGSMRAEERVSAFLLNLSHRLESRGYSAREFQLRMKREQVGSFLGLTLETVSRMLSKFQKDHLINVQGRMIEILDFDGLQRIGLESMGHTAFSPKTAIARTSEGLA